MVRTRLAAVVVAMIAGAAALVGSAATASAADGATAKDCGAWTKVDGAHIKHDVSGAVGGGLEVEKRQCPSPDFPNRYYYEHRLKMLIYGEMRPNTRAVATIFGDTTASCSIYPTDGDQFCATAPVTGADKAWGLVQERRDGSWVTYARGGMYI